MDKTLYEYEAKVRYNEIDEQGRLTVPALLDLFQNASGFQSEELGFGIEYLENRKEAWVLSSWQICINKMPFFAQKVRVQTWPYSFRRALGNRNYRILDEQGNTLACADSFWAYVSTEDHMIKKFPPEMIDAYGTLPELEMEKAPRKIALPENMKAEEPFEVKYYFIDTNHHMNNAKYILAASEYLPGEFEVKEVRAEYKKSAMLGDTVYPFVSAEKDCVTVSMCDAAGEVYAAVQFISP